MVDDMRVFRKVIGILKARNVSFKINLDGRCGVVITDNLKLAEECTSKLRVPVILVSNLDVEGKVELAILMLKGRLVYESLIVGLDPGKTIGYALIGDDELLEVENFNNTKPLIDHLKVVMETYPYKRIVIRIGAGEYSTQVLDEVLNLLENFKVDKEVAVEIVDESRTSKSQPQIKCRVKIPKRAIAAVNIALRRGIPVHVY